MQPLLQMTPLSGASLSNEDSDDRALTGLSLNIAFALLINELLSALGYLTMLSVQLFAGENSCRDRSQ